MTTFLIVNGILLALMVVALIWVRALERRQKAAKQANVAPPRPAQDGSSPSGTGDHESRQSSEEGR